ncbi:MAG: hypothetical protein HFI90_06725 [Clostridia bacterium]|nr:hypothetical protein [Clostridia bacterium]
MTETARVILPESASFDDSGLLWNDRLVCNFLPIVNGTLVPVEAHELYDMQLSIKLQFVDKKISPTYFLKMSELEKLDWFSLNQKCRINPDCTKAVLYLADIMRSQIASLADPPVRFCNRPGIHIVDEQAVFCTGNKIYDKNLHNNVELALMPISLDIDENLSEFEAAKKMFGLVNLSPTVGRMLLAQNLLGIMRHVFLQSGITPSSVLFVVGKSGLGKTTYTSFLSQLYNRKKGIVPPAQLTSSFSAIQSILSDPMHQDSTVVFDDMFPTNSGEIRRNFEKTFSKLVRFIGNQNSPALMNGKMVAEREPSCGVIIVGEYPQGLGSDAARCLIVEMRECVLNEKLCQYQREPLVVSTFYHFFIGWYVSNYDKIGKLLKEWLYSFRTNNHLDVNSHLSDAFFCFVSAFKLFLLFCLEKSFASEENAKKQYLSFHDSLIRLVKKQNLRTEQGIRKDSVDIFQLICRWYQNKDFDLAKDCKHLKNKDGFKYKGLFCIKPAKLLEKIQQVVPGITIVEVSRALREKSALKLDCEGKNYKVGNERFYGIYIEKLNYNR